MDVRLQLLSLSMWIYNNSSWEFPGLKPQTGATSLVPLVLRLLVSWTEQLLVSWLCILQMPIVGLSSL
jgi:hypothetical protein